MSSTVYHSHTHRTSWESAPSYHKYPVGQYDGKPGQSPSGILKKIRKSLCGVFASELMWRNPQWQSPTKHVDGSVDSLAYAQSDDDSVLEAESIDEDNMAWGRPSKRPKHRNTHTKSNGNKEASPIPSSSDSTQASYRLW
ncbi:hypothetical protein A7U60_g3284 [Sanghuangporus baumii]|uniref:Uncharacterized protein n=1 Tax=Sanghuangporus baumii TaxID=108892 RepID=A0A9Q5I0X0_SANBA|nr:hypothetical protein A7U60_g3284 [Sanghuangporus baumii]